MACVFQTFSRRPSLSFAWLFGGGGGGDLSSCCIWIKSNSIILIFELGEVYIEYNSEFDSTLW